MNYRRARVAGACYFFTVVTYKRQKILGVPENVSLLRDCFRYVMARHPFVIDAAVVLPDHLHCLWTLPEGDVDFSTRWRLVKSQFTRQCEPKYRERPSRSRREKKEQALWQRRYWEHLIRDEHDYANHVDYIHYNPVKHGLTKNPLDWKYSSFHQFVQQGLYQANWGATEEIAFEPTVGHE